MSLISFKTLASETFGLHRIASKIYKELEREGVPESSLFPLQASIKEASQLLGYLRDKSKHDLDVDIVDLLDNYPAQAAEWIRLKNDIYENINTIIHQFSITENEHIKRWIVYLQRYKRGSYAEKTGSKEVIIDHMINSIQENWLDSTEGLNNLAKKNLESLLRYVIHLQETSQMQEAGLLIEKLFSLNIDHISISLIQAQLLIKRGDKNSAREIICQILEEDPENELALALKKFLQNDNME